MLLDKTQAADLKLWALGAPFESKDKLKKRSYRWEAERKTWHKTIAVEDLDQEVNWLRFDVYGDRPFKLEQEQMDAYNRFSNRRGVTDIVSY